MVHSEALGILYVMRRYHAFPLSSEDVGSACDGETHFRNSSGAQRSICSLPVPRESFEKVLAERLADCNLYRLEKSIVCPRSSGIGFLEPGPKSVSSIFRNPNEVLAVTDFVLILFSRASQGTRLLSLLHSHGLPLSSPSIQGCNKHRYLCWL